MPQTTRLPDDPTTRLPTVRALLVGCGGISRAWLTAARDIAGLEIVGLVDLDREVARQRAAEFGLADRFIGDDIDAALSETAPDAVFDCAVPEAHAGITLAALRAGCHVLGEKPLATTLADARRLVAAAREVGKIFAVIQNRRYDPNIRRLRAFLQSGAIGRLTAVESDFHVAAHFGGFRDAMPHVLLLDMAIHTFDAARLLTGADPLTVYCHEWNPPGSWYAQGAAATAIFELTGDIVYTYRGSWCAEGLNTAWEAAWRVTGERGSVTWDGADGFAAQVVAEPGRPGRLRSTYRDVAVPPLPPGEQATGHAGVLREFVRCVRDGATPETAAADNIKSLAMVLGAIESAERGERVALGVGRES